MAWVGMFILAREVKQTSLTCVHACMYVCMCVCMCACVCTCACVCVCVCVCACVQACMCAYVILSCYKLVLAIIVFV